MAAENKIFNNGTIQIGNSASEEHKLKVFHSDNTYVEIYGYGLYMSRVNSYIRPTGDKTQILAVGADGKTWNYISSNANYHTFSTDSTEHMRITSAGNVGIGTTSPAQKLHVEGSVLIDAFNAGNETGIFFREGFYNYNVSILAYDHNGDGTTPDGISINGYDGVSFSTGANTRNERMRITQSGNVGIGTSSPTSRLEVRSETATHQLVSINRAASDVAALYIGNDTSNNPIISANNAPLIFGKDVSGTFTEYMRINEYGLVGINDTVGFAQLTAHSYQNNFAAAWLYQGNLEATGENNPVVEIGYGGGGTQAGNYQRPVLNVSSNNPNKYLATFGNATVITGDGSIGIDTTNPQAKLQVGSITSSVYSLTTGSADIIGSNKDISDTQMGTLNVTSTSRRSSSPFNQGYGPSITFTQNGSGYVNGYEKVIGGIKTEIRNATNLDYASIMQFYTHNNSSLSAKMTIDAGGNVGIGTTGPVRKLHVSTGNGDPAARFENTTSNATVLELVTSGDGRVMYLQTDHIYVNSGAMHFGNSTGDIYLRTSSAGGVGIGTTSPSYKLDVAGDVGVSGNLNFSGGTAKKIITGSQRSFTLPAQGTRMRILTIANGTSCRVYLDSSENSYIQPIVLDIFFRSQSVGQKPQIVRLDSYEWHGHSNDIIFTSDGAATVGGETHIYAEKVDFSTGRNVNIRQVIEYKGTVTVLDGSVTDTNGGTDETILSNFEEITTNTLEVTGSKGYGVDSSQHSIYMSSGGRGLGGEFGTGYARNLIKSDGNATIHIGDNTSLISQIKLDAGSSATNGYITFLTKQSERMRVNENGYVGIGTTSPSSKLHVVGNGFFDGARDISLNSSNGSIRISAPSSGGWATGMYFDDASGNDVGGFGTYGTATTFDYFWIGDAYNDTTLVVEPNAGNVGVGTTSPSEKLEVSGIAYATSGFKASGSSLLRKYVSSWTSAPTHDIIYNGWTASAGDYMYLKSAGNSTTNHGIAVVADNGFYVGRTNLETGAISDNLTNPIDDVWFYADTGKFVLGQSSAGFSPAYNSISGLFISSENVAHGVDEYGVGIEFGKMGVGPTVKKAAITPVGTGGDNDNVGLAFHVSQSGTQADPTVERVRINNTGLSILSGKLFIGNTSTNTTSTSALVLNGSEVQKRTLGSAAFSDTTDFDPAGTDNSTDVTLDVTNAEYLSLSGQEITLAKVKLTELNGGATAGLLKTSAAGVVTVDTNAYALSTHTHSYDNYGEWHVAGDADSTDVTSGKWVKFVGAASIAGAGTEASPYLIDLSGSYASSSHTHTLSDITDAGTAAAADTSAFDAAGEADAVQDNLDSLVSSLGTAAYTASTDYAAASHTHTFASLTSKPTTLSGYGITDAIYTPDVYEINNVSVTGFPYFFEYSATKVMEGSTNTALNLAGDGITVNEVGIYEVKYTVAMENPDSTRKNPAIRAELDGTIIKGSRGITYLRLPGANQSPYGSIEVSFYMDVRSSDVGTDLKLKMALLNGTAGSIVVFGYHATANTISIRRIS